LELPADRLGVGLIGGEDVLPLDLRRGAVSHPRETLGGELQMSALACQLGMRHCTNATRGPAAVVAICLRAPAHCMAAPPAVTAVAHLVKENLT
jgi:hypothetical protein